MPTMLSFTEADIRAGASSQSFSRGMAYYKDGAVLEIIRRGAAINAEVEGSEYEPYEVTVRLGASGGIDDADCTCPYDYGGYCKHIVAVLLEALNDAESVEQKPDLPSLLNGLDDAQLRQIIVNVVATNPRLVSAIEHEVNAFRRTSPDAASAGDLPPAPPRVDVDAIRRDMRRRFRQAASDDGGGHRGYYDYDEFYIDAGAIIDPSIQAADALLSSGDPAGAAALLTGVIGPHRVVRANC